MNRVITLIALFSILTSSLSFGQYDDRLDYIDSYAEIAVREMHRTGIPASIKLAQAVLESNAGKSELARKANNHFGIKCGNRWQGGTFHKKDDDYQGGRLIKSCFRRFKDPEASFIAHSKFLTDPNKSHRYGFLFEIDPTDYKRWARGLKRSGYATNPKYDHLLIDLIERYELYRFDSENSEKQREYIADTKDEQWLKKKEAAQPEDMIRIENEVEYILAREGETIQSIAIQFNTSERRLLKYNERYSEAGQTVEAGSRIYLQRKRRNYRGRQQYHRVREGENMYDIAQGYGLRLDILYKHNRLKPGQQPAIGERIRLRGKVDRDEAPDVRKPGQIESKGQKSRNSKRREGPKEGSHPIFDDELVLSEEEPPAELTKEDEILYEASEKQDSAPHYHTVQAGNTLYSIARRYNVSIESLKQWNDLDGNMLSIGQKLEIR